MIYKIDVGLTYHEASVGGGLNVGDDDAGAIGRSPGDGAGAAAAAAVVLTILVLIAVCEDEGGKAENEDVFDLHVEGWGLFLGGR
jgi:hypothetical protein